MFLLSLDFVRDFRFLSRMVMVLAHASLLQVRFFTNWYAFMALFFEVSITFLEEDFIAIRGMSGNNVCLLSSILDSEHTNDLKN